LYVVNYAHLDTQWRWGFPLTIEYFLPETVQGNIDYFERFPSHIFNFTGASRYELLKEYLPEHFEAVRRWVKRGRWFPAGNQWEECDVLVPSSESIIRQILMGSRFFSEEFGTESQEFMLPDSFGFPASLPSILSHCGLRGFSTQKLTWNPVNPIPFNVGKWQGNDGRGVIAALNAGNYGAVHSSVLSQSRRWVTRLDDNGKVSGLKVDYLYNGTGDYGGTPHEVSMVALEKSLQSPGPVKVVVGPSDAMFRDISDAQAEKLPTYEGDLLLTEHSAGSLTSQSFIKQLNRKNELLANAAERASVVADFVGGNPYPALTLRHAWRGVLRSQFHDILAGTSVPKAYEYSWNDEFLAMNEFAYALTDAAGAVARGLDTRVDGVPIVVYNPLSRARTDLVEVQLPQQLLGERAVTAFDATGNALLTQLTTDASGQRRVLFSASLPGDTFAVFSLKSGVSPVVDQTLQVSERGLSNARYRVTVDEGGDISGLFDVTAGREMLRAPIRLAFLTEYPSLFPAWNMDWADRKQPPRGYVVGRPKVEVLETGPLRVALRVERQSEGSFFTQTIRLAAGPSGERVEILNRIDWKSTACSLKATFPLSVSNPKATYSWGLGTIQRGNNHAQRYEVPTHSFIDLTDEKNDYGVALLTGAKYGSDKPTNDTLRLTLLFTPEVSGDYHEQRYQDWGRHDISYALVGHRGGFRNVDAHFQAERFEQPLLAFAVDKHEGSLGKRFGLFEYDSDQVALRTVKRSEDGKSIVLRFVELSGRKARTRLRAAYPLLGAWEMNGIEKIIAPLPLEPGSLRLDFLPYQMRTVSVSLAPRHDVAPPNCVPLNLAYNLDAVSYQQRPMDGNCDGAQATYPAEMLPERLQVGGIEFRLGSFADGKPNALVADGQVMVLPRGYSRVFILAASMRPREKAVFLLGEKPVPLEVGFWSDYLGQWDNRVFVGDVPEITYSVNNALAYVAPAYLQQDRVAWSASHQHDAVAGDVSYRYSYLFSYAVDIPPHATTLTLPKNANYRIFAITVAKDDNAGAAEASPLWPDLTRDADFMARFGPP
jgi:alpha-mannosidase